MSDTDTSALRKAVETLWNLIGKDESRDGGEDVHKGDFDITDVEKSALSSKARNDLPDSAFALSGRRYPIHDRSHAANALARVAQHGTPEEKAKVRAAVHRKYPDMGKQTKAENVVPLWKAEDDARQIVYGAVLVPGVEDSQGDTVDAPEIELAAHRWLAEYRKHDVQHDEQEAAIKPVESFVAPVDMEIAGEQVLKGSWVMAAHISDADTWGRVEKKEITGFSIGGTGERI